MFQSIGLRQNEPTFIFRAQQEQVESLCPTATLFHPSPGGGAGLKVKKSAPGGKEQSRDMRDEQSHGMKRERCSLIMRKDEP